MITVMGDDGNMRETEAYKQAVKDIYFWQYGDSTSFSSCLVHLLAKADVFNFLRLRNSFPELTLAFKDWQQSETCDSFFKEHGLM